MALLGGPMVRPKPVFGAVLRTKPHLIPRRHLILDDYCWLTSLNPHRYATFNTDRGQVVGHRWIWAKHHDREVPPGMVVHHVCFRKSCVNPKHLALATYSENSQLRDWEIRCAEARRAA
jgi:hypothetical protein